MLETDKANELHSTQKIVTEEIVWTPEHAGRYRLKVKVLAPALNEILFLRGMVGITNHSFVLLYRNYPVRKYTHHFYHKSKSTGEVFREPHKHIWEKETEDDKAYIPEDIDPSADINEQFLSFLKEENIILRIPYQYCMFR